MASFGNFIISGVVFAEQQLTPALQGFTFPELDAHIARTTNPDDPENWIREDVQNTTPGYSLISDKRNPFWKYDDALLAKILSDPVTADKFMIIRKDGQAQPKISAIWAFFTQAEDFVEAIFTAKHPTSAPDRGTELAVILANNSTDTACNIHFFTGYLAIVGVYNKTRHNTGQDKLIARFVPPRIARLMLYYMTLILPLLRLWAPEIFSEELRIRTYDHHFFTKAGRPMQSHQFSMALHNATSAGLHVGLGIADWRQLYKAIMRQMVGIDIDDDDEGDSTMDSAFGHSRAVGDSTYGLTFDALPNLSAPMFRKYLILGKRIFQKYGLQHPNAKSETLEESAVSFDGRKLTELGDKIDSILELLTTKNDVLSDRLQEVLTQAILPDWKSDIRNTIVKTITDEIPWSTIGTSPTQIPTPDHYQISVHSSRLNAVQALYGVDASFKSPEQAQIFEATLQRQHHVIGILPTGGGKSFLFFAPSLVELSGITVVIVPLVACEQDVYNQGVNLGLKIAIWPPTSTNSIDLFSVRIVIVSAHNAGEEEFYDWTLSLLKSNLLSRVVFDEFQNFYTSNSYRPCFNNMVRLMGLDVAFLALSATAPSIAIPVFLAQLGLKPESVLIIRAVTERPEIELRTIKVDSVDAALNATVAQIQSQRFSPGDVGIVFCKSKNLCDKIAQRTGYPIFTGDLTRAAKDDLLLKWTTGQHRFLISTIALSEGVNYAQVRVAIQVGVPSSATEFRQEGGRIGRDGLRALCLTIFWEYPNVSNFTGLDIQGIIVQSEYMRLTEQCRRLIHSLFFDGKALTCAAIKGAILCDFCSKVKHLAAPPGKPFERIPDPGTACQLAPPLVAELTTSKLHAVPSGPSSYFADSISSHQAKGKGKAIDSPGEVVRSANRSKRYHSPDPLNLAPPTPSPAAPSRKRTTYPVISPSLAAPVASTSRSRVNARPGPPATLSHPAPPAPVSRPAVPSTPRPQSNSRPAPPKMVSRPESNSRPGPSRVISDQARAVRQAQTQQTSVYGAVKHIIDWMHDICPICFIFGSTEHHDVFDCPRGVCDKSTPYGRFRNSYTRASLRKIKGCWRCFAPHAAPVSHPRSNGSDCITEALKPILYAIYVVHDLRKAVFDKGSIALDACPTLDSYMEFLLEPDLPDPLHAVLNMYHLLKFFFTICQAGELQTDGKFTHPPE